MTGVALGIDEDPGRAFAAPREIRRDTAILEGMRGTLRRRCAVGGLGGTWREANGDEHFVVIPDLAALEAAAPAVAVGFFGQARADVDHAPIVDLERALLSRADELAGLLAYHDVLLREGRQWGNLVVFATDADPSALAADDEHQLSVALAPAHYHSIRLHRYALPGGALGHAPLQWIRTTYLDFSEIPPWRAVRAR